MMPNPSISRCVTNMSSMFRSADSFNQPLEAWNVSNVTDMSWLFNFAESLNQPLEKWDVSNVTEMSGMFRNATKFNHPLEKWDVSNVCYMDNMFKGATKFNQYPKSWVVPEEQSDGMFVGTKVENISMKKPLKTAFNEQCNIDDEYY